MALKDNKPLAGNQQRPRLEKHDPVFILIDNAARWVNFSGNCIARYATRRKHLIIFFRVKNVFKSPKHIRLWYTQHIYTALSKPPYHGA
jgi:hypothetical protein